MVDGNVTRAYLEALRGALGPAASAAGDFLDETRDHLCTAVEAGVAAGAIPAEAEREAVARFGSPGEIAHEWLAERRRSTFALATLSTSLAIAGVFVVHAGLRMVGAPSNPAASRLLFLAGICAITLAALHVSARFTTWMPAVVHVSVMALALFGASCVVGGAGLGFLMMRGSASMQALGFAEWGFSLAAMAGAVWGVGWTRLTWRVA